MKNLPAPYQWNEPRLWRRVAKAFRTNEMVKATYLDIDIPICDMGICKALSYILGKHFSYEGPAFELLKKYTPFPSNPNFSGRWWSYANENRILRARLCEQIARDLSKGIDRLTKTI
jgi:hypothetical protein